MSSNKMMSVQSFAESVIPPAPVMVLLSATDLYAPLLSPLLMHDDVSTASKGAIYAPKAIIIPTPSNAAKQPAVSAPSLAWTKSIAVPSAQRRSTARLATPVVGKVAFDRGVSSCSESDGEAEVSDPGRAHIPRPRGAIRTSTDELFNWTPEVMANVKNRLHALADKHLDPSKSFQSQDARTLQKVRRLINDDFPMLKDYQNNWASNRILQAHLKVTAAAATKSTSRGVVQAVASAMNAAGKLAADT
ncbi:hypothetical protein B0H10DRAFT_2341834 [Mycena sp. CBHHK59/15]|nr:hypothetical protein B0H10DRAFT_2341834 [Mycena sp. CBHHK59/15]